MTEYYRSGKIALVIVAIIDFAKDMHKKMNVNTKLQLLQDIYPNSQELDQILEKLLTVALDEQQQRLQRYNRDIRAFEKQYKMESDDFYERFEIGDLGDAADFFEWSGLIDLCQELRDTIAQRFFCEVFLRRQEEWDMRAGYMRNESAK